MTTRVHRRRFVVAAALGIAAVCGAPRAQPQGRPARIGVLVTSVEATRYDAFLRGMREAGWIEGRNLAIEFRSAEGLADRLPALAAALVAEGVDVIFAGDVAAARAAQAASRAVPIVGASLSDPVQLGFAATLSRPGGNVTGLSLQTRELSGKYVELLRDTLPGLARVAVINHVRPSNVPGESFVTAGRALGVTVTPLDVRSAQDFRQAFDAAVNAHAQALILAPSPLFGERVGELAALALAHRLPSIAFEHDYAAAGGLMNYGPVIADSYFRAADYVHRILNGARPGDLPIERPTRFYLTISRRTARELGVTLPASLIARADRVID